MRFGLFGGAQAKRGGPDVDSVAGLREFVENNVEAEAALGDSLLLDQFASVEEIGERIALFRAEMEARGRVFDPMSVAVTRSIHVTATADDLERAMQARIAGRRRIDRLANRPDASSARDLSDDELRASALYGPPEAIAAKVQALRDAGVEYLLVNSAGGLRSLRRFADEVMPSFADSPVLQA